jgi:tripartite-type tricarboxylate transporter receptor subunit TctC
MPTFSTLRRQLVGAAAACLCTALLPTHAADEVVRIVVPYAPGGGVDVVTRTLAPKIGEVLGATVIVDNRAGASTNLGSELVAKSAPDGLTLLTASNTLASNGALFPKLNFNPATDLVPIGSIGYAGLVVVVNANSPYKTLAELIADGKANPDKLSYGTAGNGSSGHLACELLKTEGNFQALHVPYKGGSPAVTDLLGNRLGLMCINPVEVEAHIKAGKLRALAVMDDKPSPLLPGVPTVGALGLANSTASVWWGLAGPKGMTAAKINAINGALQQALKDPKIAKQLTDRGVSVVAGSPDQFTKFVNAERVKWTRVINAAKIQAD